MDIYSPVDPIARRIVHVCTPHDLHEGQAIVAMEAGCHVLLEKPIATTAQEADRMAAVAERTGRKMTVSHNQMFCAAHEATKARIVAGDVGGSDQTLFSKDSSGFDTGGHLNIEVLASGQVQVRFQSASSDNFVTSGSAVTTGTWHHMAFSFGANGMALFLDGQLVNSNAYTGGLGATSGGATARPNNRDR